MAIIAYLEYNSPNALWNHMKSTILETSEWILSFSIKTETSSSITTPNILVKRTVYLTITNHKKKISSCHAYHSPWHKFMMSVEWVMPKPAKFSQLCSDVNDIKSFLPNYKGSKWTDLPDLKPTIYVTQCSTPTEIPWSEHFCTRYIILESVIYCIQQQPIKQELNEGPTLQEIVEAINQ